ncbi:MULTISPECIES: hypothetical protein [Flavobacterium]|uniref:hypothetical protein n=1 Tax=Flavobacterium TaxID=237 RepID=UPI000C67E5FF|nr:MULTISPECIES: hypothetical protein [Flavobacterium]MBE98888.1 hypothetical protein [Flavobacterium sp.]MBY8962948.1 hypothetical protein [Flavobacterium coralii]
MSRIIGSFYMKKTEDGNLQGEYTNNEQFTVSTENSVLLVAGPEPYLGEYATTWREPDKVMHARLIVSAISAKDTNTYAKYKLVWSDLNNVPIYEGEAILAEGLLIGHFVSLP